MTCATCKKDGPALRQSANNYIRKGKATNAVDLLMAQACCRASKCGRLCPNLVKGPGVSQVWCVDLNTGERRGLYEALADSSFHCPEDRF